MATSEKKVELDETAKRESLKLLFEVYKHLTTLSSASIVVICTFLEKIFKTPKCIYLVIGSLICFLISIVLSVYVMPHIALEQDINSPRTRISNEALSRLERYSSSAFMVALLLLALFSIINLL